MPIKSLKGKAMNTNSEFCELACKLIDENDVISFDLFDTLITRTLIRPDDVFYLVAIKASQYGIKLYPNTFLVQRKKIEKDLRSKTFGEISDDQIYLELGNLLNLTNDESNIVKNIEREIEITISTPRLSIKRIYAYAKQKNKKIICTSDMYLSRDTIDCILRKNGYLFPPDHVFLSREIGKTKANGDLFDFIKAQSKKRWNTTKIIHFGDNAVVDLRNARDHGVRSFMAKKISDFYLSVPYVKKLFNKWLNFSYRDLSLSLYCSLVAKKFFDVLYIKNPLHNSHFGNNAYCLGYSALGYLLVGFSDWLYKTAKKDNIDTLVFVARDGYIAKCVYDIASKYYINPPKSVYLYASRRSFTVPTYCLSKNFSEIFLSNPFKGTIRKFIESRLGLEIDSSIISKLSKSNILIDDQELYSLSDDIDLFSKITKILLNEIKENSKKELLATRRYLKDLKLTERKVALVDLGYAGTIANCFNIITGQNAKSYNLIVNRGSVDVYQNRYSLDVKGYLLENTAFFNESYSLYDFIEKFETLFSTDQQQLVKNILIENRVDHVFLTEDKEKHRQRINFVNLVRSGVIDFASEFSKARAKDIDEYYIDKCKSVTLLNDHFLNPYEADIALWSDIYFENNFAGWDGRTIYANVKSNIYKPKTEKNKTDISTETFKPTDFMGKLILRYQGERKFIKFMKNKKRYFLESKRLIPRVILSRLY